MRNLQIIVCLEAPENSDIINDETLVDGIHKALKFYQKQFPIKFKGCRFGRVEIVGSDTLDLPTAKDATIENLPKPSGKKRVKRK